MTYSTQDMNAHFILCPKRMKKRVNKKEGVRMISTCMR